MNYISSIYKKILHVGCILIIGLALSRTVAFTSADAQESSEPSTVFIAGKWQGIAQFLTDGSFFSCLMSADYGNGNSVAFGINHDYKFWFGLSSANWELPNASRHPIIYTIGGYDPVTVIASAPFSNLILADFLEKEKSFQRLREAKTMGVFVSPTNEDIALDLKDIDKALVMLIDCVDNFTGMENGDAFKTELPQDGEKI